MNHIPPDREERPAAETARHGIAIRRRSHRAADLGDQSFSTLQLVKLSVAVLLALSVLVALLLAAFLVALLLAVPLVIVGTAWIVGMAWRVRRSARRDDARNDESRAPTGEQ